MTPPPSSPVTTGPSFTFPSDVPYTAALGVSIVSPLSVSLLGISYVNLAHSTSEHLQFTWHMLGGVCLLSFICYLCESLTHTHTYKIESLACSLPKFLTVRISGLKLLELSKILLVFIMVHPDFLKA